MLVVQARNDRRRKLTARATTDKLQLVSLITDVHVMIPTITARTALGAKVSDDERVMRSQ